MEEESKDDQKRDDELRLEDPDSESEVSQMEDVVDQHVAQSIGVPLCLDTLEEVINFSKQFGDKKGEILRIFGEITDANVIPGLAALGDIADQNGTNPVF